MLFSCKCLNFVASSNTSRSSSSADINQLDKNTESNAAEEGPCSAATADGGAIEGGSYNTSVPTTELINAFISRYPRNCVFYSQCMELLKQSIGPFSELTLTIHQRDLICTLNCNSWSLNICINCNTAVCAKHNFYSLYLVNSNLLTTNEEIIHRKASKSFSETFGILLMDRPLPMIDDNPFEIKNIKSNSRLRSLTQSLEARLEKEITDTDERIQRYTEQQFALFKSFREKSEQEYQILVSLVEQVPESLIGAMGIVNNLSNTPPLTKIIIEDGVHPTNSSSSAIDSNSQQATQSVFTFNNKKITNFDTPPATPENTPMSVGNSPTFNRQQQQAITATGGTSGTVSAGVTPIGNGIFFTNTSNNTPGGMDSGIDGDGDCFFELEGIESYPITPRTSLELSVSDVEECAEDAEDALVEIEGGIPIPNNKHLKNVKANNFAKSLPIAIVNSVKGSTIITDSDDDILDENVDIAASIKALAKSVHGDAVFGDLPRPRLRTQI